MKYLYAYWMIGFSLLLMACSGRDGKQRADDFVRLQHQDFMDEHCLLGAPTNICLTDSLVVIVDTKSDSIFHFIDRNSGKHRGDYGCKGQAPGEYLLVSCVAPYRHDTVCFYDVNKHQLSYMRMSPSRKAPVVWKGFHEPEYLHCYLQAMPAESKFVTMGIYQDACVCVLDKDGKRVGLYAEFPFRDERERHTDKVVLSQAYMASLCRNAESGYFAYAVFGAELLSIFRLQGDSVKLVKEVHHTYPDYTYGEKITEHHGLSKETPFGYIAACGTPHFIYVLYSGKSYKEHQLNAFLGHTVLVYDWEGRLLKELALDLPASLLCVDDKDEYLYAVVADGEYRLVRYPL